MSTFNWEDEGFSSYTEAVSRLCVCKHKLSEHLGGYDEDESCARRDCGCLRFAACAAYRRFQPWRMISSSKAEDPKRVARETMPILRRNPTPHHHQPGTKGM